MSPFAASFHPASSHGLAVIGYRLLGVDLVIGFLPRNGDGGDALRQFLQIEVPID